MTQRNSIKNRQNTYESVMSTLSLGCVLIVIVLLGARIIVSADLGYHLAFGETFFESGIMVDHNPFIYTLPSVDAPVVDRPEPGPGNWYDNEGKYRFPNANWLSQLFIYGSWHLSEIIGLNVLQIILTIVISASLIIAMRRCKVPFYLVSMALLLVGLILSFRLNVRPELFGYLCLSLQFMMLSKLIIQADKLLPFSWSWAGGIIFVQLLFVNLHSYFFLGLALTGTVLTEYILIAIEKRFVDKNLSQFQAYKKTIYCLSLTLIGMVLVCFVNPWGWRLALLPLQTLLYMKKYTIDGQISELNPHPWDYVMEIRSPISGHWPTELKEYDFWAMLALAGVAILLQLVVMLLKLYKKNFTQKNDTSHQEIFRIKWAYIFMIIGMVFVGSSMKRNVAVASLIVIPSAVICISGSIQYLLAQKFERVRLKLSTLASLAVVTLSVYVSYLIINDRLFEKDFFFTRLGFGISNKLLPMSTADWLNQHAPDARVWSDFSSSSTIHFFTRPHKDVPILTNGWSYPPEVLRENQYTVAAKVPFNLIVKQHNIDAVILSTVPGSIPLLLQLARDPGWKMVHVKGFNVLYMRSNSKYRTLVAKHEIKLDNFDVYSFVSKELREDPSLKSAILSVSETFKGVGEFDIAINIIKTGLNSRPPSKLAWEKLLNIYIVRSKQYHQNRDKRFFDDIKQMKYVLQRILELDPKNVGMRDRLNYLNGKFPLLIPPSHYEFQNKSESQGIT